MDTKQEQKRHIAGHPTQSVSFSLTRYSMKVFYHKMKAGNFGDDLNAELWHRAFPNINSITRFSWLIGIGTILDNRIDELPGKKLVMGSGYRPGTGNQPTQDENLEIAFVRGPLSARELNLSPEKAITDPAILVPELLDFPAARDRHTIGFAPHVHSLKFVDVEAFCKKASIKFIDTRLPPEQFIPQLKSVDKLITEAMHGAITADAYGIPWTRIKFFSWKTESETIADFKWKDWGQSMNLETKPSYHAFPRVYRKRGRNLVNKIMHPINGHYFKKMIQHCLKSPEVFIVSSSQLRIQKRKQIAKIVQQISNSENDQTNQQNRNPQTKVP